MVNEKNFDGATVTVVGRAGGPVSVKEFSSGPAIAELSIAVGQGYKKGEEWVDTGTAWYTLSSTADYAADHWPVIGKGDKVRVDEARQEIRTYTKSDGTPGTDVKLKYGTLSVVQAKSQDAVPAAAASGFGEASNLPW